MVKRHCDCCGENCDAGCVSVPEQFGCWLALKIEGVEKFYRGDICYKCLAHKLPDKGLKVSQLIERSPCPA